MRQNYLQGRLLMARRVTGLRLRVSTCGYAQGNGVRRVYGTYSGATDLEGELFTTEQQCILLH